MRSLLALSLMALMAPGAAAAVTADGMPKAAADPAAVLFEPVRVAQTAGGGQQQQRKRLRQRLHQQQAAEEATQTRQQTRSQQRKRMRQGR
jgi:hypothetical protein